MCPPTPKGSGEAGTAPAYAKATEAKSPIQNFSIFNPYLRATGIKIEIKFGSRYQKNNGMTIIHFWIFAEELTMRRIYSWFGGESFTRSVLNQA